MDIKADINIDEWNEEEGTSPSLDESQQELVLSAKKAIRREAWRQLKGIHDLTIEELTQAGNIGAAKAAGKFEPKKGYKFDTYATNWIRSEIEETIAKEGRTLPLKEHIHDKLRKIMRVEHEAGRELSMEELSDKTGFSERIIRNTKRATSMWTDSLEKPTQRDRDGNIRRLIDKIENQESPCPEKVFLDKEDMRIFRKALEEFKDSQPRLYKVLIMSFGLENSPRMTNKETGEIMGISRERVRQLQERGLKRLRCMSEKKGLEPY